MIWERTVERGELERAFRDLHTRNVAGACTTATLGFVTGPLNGALQLNQPDGTNPKPCFLGKILPTRIRGTMTLSARTLAPTLLSSSLDHLISPLDADARKFGAEKVKQKVHL